MSATVAKRHVGDSSAGMTTPTSRRPPRAWRGCDRVELGFTPGVRMLSATAYEPVDGGRQLGRELLSILGPGVEDASRKPVIGRSPDARAARRSPLEETRRNDARARTGGSDRQPWATPRSMLPSGRDFLAGETLLHEWTCIHVALDRGPAYVNCTPR